MKNKIKNIFKILVVTAGCLMFASFSPSLDGRAVVVDEGVFPQGLFAKTVGYLPGDIISVTNIAGDKTIDLLVIGALDPSEGVAIMLSPEAADAMGIDRGANNIVKITKRSGQDERVYGNAVISKSAAEIEDWDDGEYDSIGTEENSDAFEEPEAEAEPETEEMENMEESAPEEEADFDEATDESEEDFGEDEFEEPAVEEEAFEEAEEEAFDEEAPEEEADEFTEEAAPEEEAFEEEAEEFAEDEAEDEAADEEALEDEELPEEEAAPEEEAFEEEETEEDFEEPEEEGAEEEAFDSEELDALPEESAEESYEEEAPAEEETEEEEPAEEDFEEAFDAEKPDELPAEEEAEEAEEEPEEDAPAEEAFAEDELEALPAETTEEEYEAIVLVPADSNPPESDSDEVEDVISPDEFEELEDNTITFVPSTTSRSQSGLAPINTKPGLSPMVETKPAASTSSATSYDKYIVPSLSQLESGKYYIQIAAYGSDENILEIINKYGSNYPITIVPMAGGKTKQVLIGPVTMDEYKVVLERFKSYGFKDAFLRKVK